MFLLVHHHYLWTACVLPVFLFGEFPYLEQINKRQRNMHVLHVFKQINIEKSSKKLKGEPFECIWYQEVACISSSMSLAWDEILGLLYFLAVSITKQFKGMSTQNEINLVVVKDFSPCNRAFHRDKCNPIIVWMQ